MNTFISHKDKRTDRKTRQIYTDKNIVYLLKLPIIKSEPL